MRAIASISALWLVAAGAARAGTLSGFVTDADNGEALPLAAVVLEGIRMGATSNSSGYYAVKQVPDGEYVVTASYIGYETLRDTLRFEAGVDIRRDWSLTWQPILEEAVVVEAESEEEQEQATQSSFIALQVEPLQQMPAMGEADLLRSLQLLPGIQSASDLTSGLYIRGGGPDQTAILLDHIPLYNPSHLFGFFSTFNPDAIKDV
ncbi:MAG: TonB-dependent receptor, partial [Gemmatimonadaceae bacterium]|nr:TonB-dependent receptor [Gemmatimonadaceae bacterium]